MSCTIESIGIESIGFFCLFYISCDLEVQWYCLKSKRPLMEITDFI